MAQPTDPSRPLEGGPVTVLCRLQMSPALLWRPGLFLEQDLAWTSDTTVTLGLGTPVYPVLRAQCVAGLDPAMLLWVGEGLGTRILQLRVKAKHELGTGGETNKAHSAPQAATSQPLGLRLWHLEPPRTPSPQGSVQL